MSRPGNTSERLICLFLLGVLVFNPPLLSIFNLPENLFGIPILFLYLFLVWMGLIVLTALTIENADTNNVPDLDQDASPPVDQDS
ncbi:MAG: hypothetical protein ACYSTL_07620 [Planctomycetota bacterium]|jgi:hypothetical protein